MGYGSGLSAQLMVAAESTVGTPVTVTRAYEFLDESINYEPTFLDGMGLKAGQAYKRASRVSLSRHNVAGGFSLEHADQGFMGLLWKHLLGSSATATQIASSTAYKQIHTPGIKTGLGLTIQAGRPQTDGTVRALTYKGCKLPSWEFSCSDNELAKLAIDVDGWNQSTATSLAVASYVATAGVFSFADATNFKIGGTASTAAGETSIASGVAISTIVKGISLKGETPSATERYGLGNSGEKREQIENAIPMITGSLDAEFTSRTEFYDLFVANTTTALQLDFAHGDAGSSNPYLLSFILPAVKFKVDNFNAAGPDILPQRVEFEAYDDGTNPVIQVKLVSKDTSVG